MMFKDNDLIKANLNIQRDISTIENIMEGEFLFGAIGGSFALGLQNSASDIDFFALFNNCSFEKVKKVEIDILGINNEKCKMDCIGINYHRVLDEIRCYEMKWKRYPTKLNYTEKEKIENVGRKDIERPDFIRSAFYRIILADEVVGKNRMQEELKGNSLNIRGVDIIDYYFSCLYGNYTEYIVGRKKVSLRKYLYCIHQILICKWLINNRSKPRMNFVELLRNFDIDVYIVDKIMHLYKENQESVCHKEGLMTEKDEILNGYISEEIIIIREMLQKGSINYIYTLA